MFTARRLLCMLVEVVIRGCRYSEALSRMHDTYSAFKLSVLSQPLIFFYTHPYVGMHLHDINIKMYFTKCCRSNFLCCPDFLRELVMFFVLLFDDIKRRKLHSRRERQSRGVCTFHGTVLWAHKYLCDYCLFNRIAWMKYGVKFGIQNPR